MNVIVYILLQVIIFQFSKCQNGGPSTFGYDASSACSKPYSRSGRARLSNLPCDFRTQNWCAVAGNFYPWHAVRRFVQENQGLMRRMYGDERHINILRAEFEKNDVELKYDDHYRHFADNMRNYQYNHEYDYYDDEEEVLKKEEEGRSFDETNSKRQKKYPKLSEYTRPHFRPTERTSSKISETSEASTIEVSVTNDTLEMKAENGTEKSLETSSVTSSYSGSKEQNFSINEIPEQIEKAEADATVGQFETESSENVNANNSLGSTVFPDTNVSGVEEEANAAKNGPDTIEREKFRPRPEYRPTDKPEATGVEGQLYQDVAAKDQQEQPVLKLRGVNACPVKEEVVAPFWANNTRGEVLALLNLYPFEQYVHWEKCTHENKQMYCRDGCRCEQQYRLHRLLAYDPNNECRGIFSDWFKFPSCCVCRCYDLPLEFRVTSRSPRTKKQQIKVKPPRYA